MSAATRLWCTVCGSWQEYSRTTSGDENGPIVALECRHERAVEAAVLKALVETISKSSTSME